MITARYILKEQLDAARWLATDGAGNEALIFELAKSGASIPRRLRYLTYSPPAMMRLVTQDAEREVSAAVLVCHAEDPLLRRQFAPLAKAMCSFENDPPSEAALERRLDGFVQLLTALGQPPKRTAQGLWAELAIVAWALDPIAAAEAWHGDVRALHDFTHGATMLEVKSTLELTREHTIGLDQLDETQGKKVVVASFQLEESADGVSVGEMMEQVIERLSGQYNLQNKVRTIVHRSLGRAVEEGTSVRINAGHARAYLRFFEAARVPRVVTPLPPEISNVHFVVDLTDIIPADLDSLHTTDPWLSKVLPV